jgi:predicted RNase H-like HicB family nuclease
MNFEIVFDQEEDGRWIAEVESLPGVMVYGKNQAEAQSKVLALALRVLADPIEVAQSAPDQVRLAVA